MSVKLDYVISVWEKKELNYWAIPKCASTFMLWNLLGRPKSNKDEINIGQVHSEKYVNYITRKEALANGFTNLAITRHPYERAASTYNDFFKKRTPSALKLHHMSFDDFLLYLLNKTDDSTKTNVHLRSQSSFICDKKGKCYCDWVSDIEYLNLKEWMEWIHPDFDVRKIHTTENDIVLNDKHKSLIFARYHEDFENLGYDKDE